MEQKYKTIKLYTDNRLYYNELATFYKAELLHIWKVPISSHPSYHMLGLGKTIEAVNADSSTSMM